MQLRSTSTLLLAAGAALMGSAEAQTTRDAQRLNTSGSTPTASTRTATTASTAP